MKKFCLLFLLLATFLFSPLFVSAQSQDINIQRAAANRVLANRYRPTLLKRFLKYVTYNSQSSETEQITPNQIATAKKLYEEIKAMGHNVQLTEHYYIFVEIPSNLPWQVPVLGFSGHYDVTPGIEGENVLSQVHYSYDGNAIQLAQNRVLDPAEPANAYLATQKGKTIVTSDGNTILGADDKAGVSILMTFLETLAQHPEKKHGPIQIVLAPNEDVGRAAEFVEETPYRPEIAFDFDGGSNGRVIIENFNARQEIFTVTGKPGHQSYAATNGYKNSVLPTAVLVTNICRLERLPDQSSDRQGYAEPHHISHPDGKVYITEVDYRLRGYDAKKMNEWEYNTDSISRKVAEQFNVSIQRRTIKNYSNVGECSHPQALQVTQNAGRHAEVELNIESARAGTTAAMFVTKGLVGAYTIFTGQNNPHAYTEWLSEEDMFKSYLMALQLTDEVAGLR